MSTNDQGFDLSVTLPATELAALRRRARYLEATLIQVMRGARGIKEWFTAAELEALHLPGLAASKGAITRQAREQGWRTRPGPGPGPGAYEYHFSTLPRRAFEALMDRVLAPAVASGQPEAQVPAIAAPPPLVEPPTDTTPPWLLPLMRVVRSEAPATVREAMELLPNYVPKGMPLPTLEEAAEALRNLGMVS